MCKTNRIRCFFAALLGALFSCLFLVGTEWLPDLLKSSEQTVLSNDNGGIENIVLSGRVLPDKKNLWLTFMLHGACAMWMIRIGCGLKKYGLLVKGMITMYLAAFLWGGFWEVLLEERSMTLKTFLLSAIGTYLGFSALIYVSDSMRIKRKHIYPITLSFQGEIHKAYGYYDTGNLLTDPFTGDAVSVAEQEFLKQILSKDVTEKLKNILEEQGELESTELASLHPRLIPVRTIGQKSGIMLAITLDELCIHTPGKVIHISKPVLGLTQEPFTLGKECKVLLNSRLIDQEGN